MKQNSNHVFFITRLSAIGDVIMATHILKKLALDGFFSVFITSRNNLEIALSCNYISHLICYEKNVEPSFFINKNEIKSDLFWEEIHKLKDAKTGKFIHVDLQNTNRSHRTKKWIKNHINIDKNYLMPKHTLKRFCLVLKASLVRRQSQKDNFATKTSSLYEKQIKFIETIYIKEDITPKTPLVEKPIFSLLSFESHSKKPYICFFPGASSSTKTWPLDKFIELKNLILSNTDFDVIWAGGKSETHMKGQIQLDTSGRTHDYIGISSLSQSMSLIANAHYVVTNDSFPLHAAHALNIPCSVIFGSTSPLFGFLPNSPRVHLCYANLNCSPCSRHGKRPCRFKNLLCMQKIQAHEIFSILKSKLASSVKS